MVLFRLTDPARTVPVKTVPDEMISVYCMTSSSLLFSSVMYVCIYRRRQVTYWIPWPFTGKQWSMA